MHAKPASIQARPAKDETLRARCDHELKNLVLEAAHRLGLDESDVIRLAARDYSRRVVFAPAALPS